ncbi:flagellar hook-associated protein FlgL [Aromatoleum evansii]|uniref:Flagellar hook-associated protein FlgL n=1 Tax=Aromatoleum evansii TaxID=59406 RepID=A0ABZ1AGL8_AROEV|nr:flagellar hook-associated protein FlgL [Aromatoleum evansii]NMG32147.1 flagellar hook-associated protein 3 [Aromatoleum evansii]WRL45017.1 flagellar hook-associated protein FlgL [Aromatoleum evansii]
MRISTGMIFDAGRNSMMRQSADLLHTQQQLASGRRILSPSDDPIGASRALEVTQSQNVNTQFQTNQGYAKDALASLESNLGSITEILTYIRTRAVEAGNGGFSASEHQAIATDLEAQFGALLGIANGKDATGDFQFAGYQTAQPAFSGGASVPSAGPGPVIYEGDDGARAMQVGSTRVMAVAEPGSKVFMADPATGESQVFGAISQFITELRKDPADPTRNIGAAVSQAIGDMDVALENVSTIRASVGSRMVELDALGELAAVQDQQYAETLSRLQDLDYNEAISRFTQQQTILEAAQQSYVRVTGLSLFNLLS